MFINDIEFIDPLSQKDLESNSAVIGGASANVSTKVGGNNGKVSASLYMKATGNSSSGALGKIKTKVISKKGKSGKDNDSYTAGYGLSYGFAYGKDDDGWVVYDTDISSVLL